MRGKSSIGSVIVLFCSITEFSGTQSVKGTELRSIELAFDYYYYFKN